MNETPADQFWGQETMQQLARIAKGIFARHGIDFASAKRAGGWTNATWLAGGLALRIATRQGTQKIRREVQLASLLPQMVGYPILVESGVDGGYEWSLSKEVRGQCLGEVWPNLTWADRAAALCQMWNRAQAVHSADVKAAMPLAGNRSWFNSNDAAEARASTRRLAGQGLLTACQAEVLGKTLDHFWDLLPTATSVLNHGDLTLDNALWNDGQVVSLLDFEYAVIAPLELDLNTLLKFAFDTEGQKVMPESDWIGLQQIRRAAAGFAKPVIAHPGGKELLLGYGILLEQWMLEDWLAHPDGEGPLEQWEPYRRLLSLADGRGGYLAPLFE